MEWRERLRIGINEQHEGGCKFRLLSDIIAMYDWPVVWADNRHDIQTRR